MRFVVVMGMMLMLAACGGRGSDETSTPPKSLFSRWVNVADDQDVLNLYGGSFSSVFEYRISLDATTVCDCRLDFDGGSQTSGIYTFSSCRKPGILNSDPNPCTVADHQGTYAKPASRLTLCDDQQVCTTYR